MGAGANTIIQRFTYNGKTLVLYIDPSLPKGHQVIYSTGDETLLKQLPNDYQINGDKIMTMAPGDVQPKEIGQFSQTQVVNGREVAFTSPDMTEASAATNGNGSVETFVASTPPITSNDSGIHLGDVNFGNPAPQSSLLKPFKNISFNGNGSSQTAAQAQAGGKGQAANSKETGGKNPLDKLMQNPFILAGTTILSGWGLYSGFKNFSAAQAPNLIFSSLMFVKSTQVLFEKMFKQMSETHAMIGGLVAVGVIAAIALAMKAIQKHGAQKEQTLDPTQGDPTAVPNSAAQPEASTSKPSTPAAWYQYLPSTSAFAILAGVAALGIGISFAPTSDMQQRITIKETQLSDVQAQLGTATGQSIPGGLRGKVFIKRGDGLSVPDQAVFVTQNAGENTGYAVNKISLNAGGYQVGPNPMALLPFFSVEPQTGAIMANQAAAQDLGVQTAMTQAANSPIAPISAAAAVAIGAATGHETNFARTIR